MGILSIVQKKTKREIRIQMDAETQNALIDYILHERRELESEYIFVTAFGHIARKTGNCRSLHSRMVQPFRSFQQLLGIQAGIP